MQLRIIPYIILCINADEVSMESIEDAISLIYSANRMYAEPMPSSLMYDDSLSMRRCVV